MIAIDLLTELRLRGATVEAAGDRLVVEAPKGVLTPAIREALAKHKSELLSLLEPVHFSLEKRPVLGVPQVEPCLVGCGSMVRFYDQGSESLGYCERCDVHQRIVQQVT
jgi:hypothetical protein